MTRPRLFLIAFLLFTASTAWPGFFDERPVSDQLSSLALGGRWLPVVATNGDGFLVAWNDGRSLENGTYVARVSANGELLDPNGIRLAAGAGSLHVFFAGDAYVVVWFEDQSNNGSLHIARIDRDGRIIDGPRVIADGLPPTDFSAATNGRRIVIAWPERLFVLSAEGELLERDIPLQQNCHTPYCSGTPLLASNGSNFLLALPFPDRVSAIALDANGHPLSSGVTVDPDAVPIALTTDGSNYMLVDASSNANATSQQISASGALLEHNDLGARLATKPFALTWNGTDYVALSRAYFADAPRVTLRLTSSGHVVQLPPPMPPKLYLPPAREALLERGAVTSNGGTLLAAWNGRANTGVTAILIERLDPSTFAATPPTVISFGAATQRYPSIAFSGINYAVAWSEESRSWLRRFSLTGDPIDAQPLPLDTGVVGESGFGPRVTFDGRNYVTAAVNGSGRVHIRLTRIDPLTGQILSAFDGPEVDDRTFDLRSDGVNAVMVWSLGGQVSVAEVGATALVHESTITPVQMNAHAPSLAWSGTQWLVAFHDDVSVAPGIPDAPIDHHVYALRLSPALARIDPQPIELGFPDWSSAGYDMNVHAASLGGEFMVAMTHVNPQAWQTVALRRIFADGSISAGLQLLTAGVPLDIVADRDRDHYAVAIAGNNPVGGDTLQYGERIDRNGAFLPHDAYFDLGSTLYRGARAQLVAGLDGIVAAYERTPSYEPEYGGVERVFLRSAPPIPVSGRRHAVALR
jgi:hypothetical protein